MPKPRNPVFARERRRQGQAQEANEQLLLAALSAQERQSAAERALGDQTALLARVAHELRNPLTPIRTAASLIDKAHIQELPQLRAVIERQVDNVSRLVGDLLDLSRAQAGKLRLQRSELDVCAVVAEVLEASRPAIHARRQRLLVDMPVRPLLVDGDRVRLTQVLTNLIDNACKYTPEEGAITVTARAARTAVVISVCDTGIGIGAEAMATVFDPFVQDPRATSFNGAGLGIGLTVVRELAEAHGGKVHAFSAGKGQGSQFVLTLPRHVGGEGTDEAATPRGVRARAKPLLVVGAMVAMLGVPTTRAADPATLANTGAGTVVACATCHGKDGGGQAAFPRLAGMNATYLLKQLGDFDSGSRANAIMQPIAKALSPEDRMAITRYYAAMAIPQAAKAGPAPASSDPGSPGAVLALRGKWSVGVPACVQCHGPGGTGVGEAFPAIAAQPAGYIAAQLRAWQAGTRKNDPIELMRHLSGKLSESEIQAVSEWFSLQPATAVGGSR